MKRIDRTAIFQVRSADGQEFTVHEMREMIHVPAPFGQKMDRWKPGNVQFVLADDSDMICNTCDGLRFELSPTFGPTIVATRI